MNEDVGLQLSEEEQGVGAGIAATEDARVDRAPEVVADDGEHATRRSGLGVRVEGDDECRLPRGEMHLHRNRGADDRAHERHELFGELAEHAAWIDRRIDARELGDERRNLDRTRAHRRGEQILLRREVTQDRGGRDAQFRRDVGECRRRESARGEHVAGGLEDLFAADARRASHR